MNFSLPKWSNKPAAGNAGIASSAVAWKLWRDRQLAIEHHWPVVPEPGRSL
jgi:hypothetical protein